ncbi:hypothetical protein J6590_028869 [Homalodisca vitripennis]|nr:hypothetical protein J6590_028869 [Homalodisca vitripennis]
MWEYLTTPAPQCATEVRRHFSNFISMNSTADIFQELCQFKQKVVTSTLSLSSPSTLSRQVFEERECSESVTRRPYSRQSGTRVSTAITVRTT